MPHLPNAKVLELGSNAPPDSVKLAEKGYAIWDRADWTGANASQSAQALTFDFNLENSWPISSNTYDLVVAWEILEHLAWHPMNLLLEAHRVLKQGGTLFLTTPNITSYRGLYNMIHGYWPYRYAHFHKERVNPTHCREYDVHVVVHMLSDAGFHPHVFTVNSWDQDVQNIDHILSSLGISNEHRGDNIFAFGTKTTAPRNPLPPYLYE
jgi:SAM-dependent methyltransferase